MHKKKIHWLKAFLVFQLFYMIGTASILPQHNRLQTGVSTTVKDTVVTEVTYKTGSFKDIRISDIITLGIDPGYAGYLGKDSINCKVILKIDGYDASNSLISTTNQTLTVTYNPFGKTFYKDQDIYQFEKAYKCRVQFMGAVINGTSSATLPDWLYIDDDINVERYYAFSSYVNSMFAFNTPVLLNIDCDANNTYDELVLSWNTSFGSGSGMVSPESFDLEWTFVNDYDSVIGSYLDSTHVMYDFTGNSTRVNTTLSSYTLSLIYEHGYLLYRVRGVGNDTSNINNILNGTWSIAAATGSVSAAADHYHITQPHQTDSMNWQYNASFAEEGKKKEVVAYYDGSSRNRQSVTKMNSDRNTLVGETIYDYQGRPAINVLPVPVDSPSCSNSEAAIKFYPNFNQDDSTNAYTRNDFDVDASTGSCNSTVAPMGDTSTGASHYYSKNNPNKKAQQAFLPDAKKYPFTQVEYTPDNTGRIKRQGGVGDKFQLNSGHETTYFYGQPSQLALDRMFGSEVGDALHYKENVVIDPNGQSSITYMNMEGKTIATSLAGDSIPYVNDIPSNKQKALKHLTYDLFNKNALGVSKADTINISGNAIEFNTQLLVPYASTQHFTYSLSIDTMGNACLQPGICFSCVYDLEMHIYNDCGVDLLGIKKTVGHFKKDADSNIVFVDSCSGITLFNRTDTFSILMNPGNYTVSKVLTINQQALNYYVTQFKDSTDNSCYRTLTNFIDSALSKVDTSSCHITCASCVAALGDRDAFVAAGKGSYMDYDGLVTACNEPCQGTTNCYVTYLQMVADMAPSGQYGEYLDNTDSVNTAAFPLSVYNTSNSLPKNIGTSTGNWHYPSIILNGVTYLNYTDENGHISTINIQQVSSGVYSPAVVNPSLVNYNSITDTYSTQPENLLNFSDFLYYWDPNWAKSLVIYHPEYCYYLNCSTFSNTYGGTYSSDAFDALLQNTQTFAAAYSNKILKYNYHNFSYNNRLVDFSQVSDSLPYDPFLLHGGSFGHTLKNSITNYLTLNGGYNGSMTEVAAYTTRCGNLYGNTSNTGCISFGDSIVVDSIRDNEWQTFVGFYLSKKESLQYQYLDSIVKGSGCPAYNSCMGDSSSTYNGSVSLGSEYSDSQQPCGSATYHLYISKTKRFSSTDSEMPSDYTSVSYQYFLQTGQCPIAADLQSLLNQIIAYGKFKSATSEALKNYSTFVPVIYNILGGGSPYKNYYWNSSTSGSLISVNFKDSAGNTQCSLGIDLSTAGISSLTNYKVIGVSGLSDTTYSTYQNAFRVYITLMDTTDTTIVYKKALGYSSCFNLIDCKFQEKCTPNDFAGDLQKLMSALAATNNLYSSSVSLDVGYTSYITSQIKNQLGPLTSNKLIWNFTDSTHYQLYDSLAFLTDSTKLLINLITKPSGTPTFRYHFVKAFNNINSDYYNLFSIVPLNSSNVALGTTPMTGEVFKQVILHKDTSIYPISMGSCGYPTSFSCQGNEYRLQNDLQVLLHDVLVGMPASHNVDLTKFPNYTYLLSNSFPTGLTATSSTLNTGAPGLNKHYKTQLLFTLKSSSDSCYFSLNADTLNHHAFDSIVDFSSLKSYGSPDAYGDYHSFYGIAKYSAGAGAPSTDTIFGQTCLPIKICCACPTGDTISFNNGGGGANGAGSGNYNPKDTCKSLYNAYVSAMNHFCSTHYAESHEYCTVEYKRLTYDDIIHGNYCGCLSSYTNYLNSYDTTYAHTPVSLSSYTNCPSNNTNTYPSQCAQSYALDTAVISKFNTFVTTNSLTTLPHISKTKYTSVSFGTNGFCYCSQSYVIYLESIITGGILPAAVDTNMLDIGKYCQAKYIPPCKPYVQPDTANSGFPTTGYPVTPPPDNSCVQNAIGLAVQNATNQYNQYNDSITTSISGAYLHHCLGAFESFTEKYLDKEYHYTLYYYDQAGNLIRTIPPEGVNLVGDTVSPTTPITSLNSAEDSICHDRTYNQHNFLTNHTMPTTYVYNSLNQLVKQSLPDHDPLNIWEYALPIGIDSKLKIMGVQFVDDNTGYLSGYVSLNDTIKPGIVKRGYIYSTSDGGKTWAPMDGVVSSYINKLQMITPYSGYAVCNKGMILKTVDAGQNWDVVPTYNKYTNLWSTVPDWKDLFFKDTTKGVIVGTNGKSLLIDFTQTAAKYIKPVSLTTGHTDNLTGVTFDGSNVYASAVSTDGTYGLIYKSNMNPFTSDSLKWDSVQAFKGDQLLATQFLPDSTKGFIGGTAGTILKTTNRGKTWIPVSNNLTGDVRNLYFRNDSVGVALVDSATGYSQIYKTSNGGATWTLLGNKGKYYNDMSFYKYASAATSDKAYVVGLKGSVNRLIASTSGTYGQAPYFGMAPLNSPNIHKNFTSVSAANYTVGTVQKSKVLIGASDGTIYYSFNNADSTYIIWDSLPLASSVSLNKAFLLYNSGVYLAAAIGSDGNLYGGKMTSITTQTNVVSGPFTGLTIDARKHWVYTYDNTNKQVARVGFISGSIATVLLGSANSSTNNFNGIGCSGNLDVFVVGDSGTVYKDTSITSTPVWGIGQVVPAPLYDIHVDNGSPKAVYAVGKNGTLLQKQHALSTWKKIKTSRTNNFNAINFYSNTNGVVAADSGKIYSFVFNASTYALTAIHNVKPFFTQKLNDISVNINKEAFAVGNNGVAAYIHDITTDTVATQANLGALTNNLMSVQTTTLGLVVVAGANSSIYAAQYSYSSPSLTTLAIQRFNSIFPQTLNKVHFTDANNGYVVGDNGFIRHTNDGQTWQVVLPDITRSKLDTLSNVFTYQPDKAIIVGKKGYMASVNNISTPAAISTSALSGTPDLNDIAFCPNSPNLAYGVGSNKTAFTLSLPSFSIVALSIPSYSFASSYNLQGLHVFADNSFITVGSKGTIAFYNAGSSSWLEHDPPLNPASQYNFQDVCFTDDQNGYVVGNNGVVLKWHTAQNIQKISTSSSYLTTNFKSEPTKTVDLYGVPDSTLVTISSVAFSAKNYGFLGGGYMDSINNADYARYLHDESDNFSTHFWYDALGRMVISQNSKQFAAIPKQYSYTTYDALGRITEVGQKTENAPGDSNNYRFNDVFSDSLNNSTGISNGGNVHYTSFINWLKGGEHTDVTCTYYDTVAFSNIPLVQQNLRKRVSSTTFSSEADGIPADYDYATHYSYDVHGNVTTLLQDNPQLTIIKQQYKRVDYDYDLISGKVNYVYYQKDSTDQFSHKYEYDADNRITDVYTSSNGSLWYKEAKYYYYAHGPLARVEYGNNQVQGTDYYYTLQGWIKGVNSNVLNPKNDGGHDGLVVSGNANSNFARDAYGYTLGYYSGDYTPIDTSKWNTISKRFEANTTGSSLLAARHDLFNGNIGHMVTSIIKPDTNYAPQTILPQGTAYKYDQLNRLVEMQAYTNISNNAFGTTSYTGSYNNCFTYDENGNILTQVRKNQSGVTFDSLTYNYNIQNGKKQQNRLYSVQDTIPASVMTDDIDNQAHFNPTLASINTTNNYSYDQIGNLVKDSAEGIAIIAWNVYGKIEAIRHRVGSYRVVGADTIYPPDLIFNYDPAGNRISKEVIARNASGYYLVADSNTVTYYVRDAQGNVMSTYKETFKTTGHFVGGHFVLSTSTFFSQTEKDIYGSSRIGVDNTQKQLIGANLDTVHLMHTLGNKQYEMTNHLGNVLTTISDAKLPVDTNSDGTIDRYVADIRSATNYYPFGAPMEASSCHTYTINTVDTLYYNDGSSLTGITTDNGATFSLVSGQIRVNDPLGDGETYSLRVNLSMAASTTYSVEVILNVDSCSNSAFIGVQDLDRDGWDAEGTTSGTYSDVINSDDPGAGHLGIGVSNGPCHYYVSKIFIYSSRVDTITTCNDSLPGGGYRYGFNGQEKDDETYGQGNEYDYGERMYDPRIGRWMSVDPKVAKYPGYSPYNFAVNSPIVYVDPDGGDIYPATATAKGEIASFIKQPTSNSVINAFFDKNKATSTYKVQPQNGEAFNIETFSIDFAKGGELRKLIKTLQKDGAITEDDAKTATALFNALSDANPILEIGSYNNTEHGTSTSGSGETPIVKQLTTNDDIQEFANKEGNITQDYDKKIREAKTPEEKSKLEAERTQKQGAAIDEFTENSSEAQFKPNKGSPKITDKNKQSKSVSGQFIYKTGANQSHNQIKDAVQKN